MPCNRYIPGMKLTLGRHDLAQDFYVMDLPNTNIRKHGDQGVGICDM
jgi:hypothetical protein